METSSIPFWKLRITDGFWRERQTVIAKRTASCVYNRFSETGRFQIPHTGWREAGLPRPHIYWDSDIAKWLEGASNLLAMGSRPDLEEQIDQAVQGLLSIQREDGYLNSYFAEFPEEGVFTDRTNHELYCAGHLIEAAVALYEATGRRDFLDAVCRFADRIDQLFRLENSARFETPGHPELEYALTRLYQTTGCRRYLDLSLHFLHRRGRSEKDDQRYDFSTDVYFLDHAPLAEQSTAEGHAVRAMYLYTAMAEAGRLAGDQELLEASRRIFENVTKLRMYLTGGIGSSKRGECFTVDYDLPDYTSYAETCAAIGFAMFCRSLSLSDPNSVYADTAERILYNAALHGVSLDGASFFYTNALAADPALARVNRATDTSDISYPSFTRSEMFETSCCPPNLLRFISSVGSWLYSENDDVLFVHQYMDSLCEKEGFSIRQTTRYPANSEICLQFQIPQRTAALRIPAWAEHLTLDCPYHLKNGYAYISVVPGQTVHLSLAMEPVFVFAHPSVRSCFGKTAIMRGPVVYCAEGIDNGDRLFQIQLSPGKPFREAKNTEYNVPDLVGTGFRPCEPETDTLYGTCRPLLREIPVRLIPYFSHANRGETEMLVWFSEKEQEGSPCIPSV